MSAAATYHATVRKLEQVRQSLHGNGACRFFVIQDRYQSGASVEEEAIYLETKPLSVIIPFFASLYEEGVTR
jgi:hypothetical protein